MSDKTLEYLWSMLTNEQLLELKDIVSARTILRTAWTFGSNTVNMC